MRRIEQYAMRFYKSYQKMKASFVQTDNPFSENHLMEVLLFQRLMGSLTKFRSPVKFKIIPYGMIKAEDDLFRILKAWVCVLSFVLFISCICLYFCWIPIIRKLFVWGWRFVKKNFLSCQKLYRRIDNIIMRIKEKEM